MALAKLKNITRARFSVDCERLGVLRNSRSPNPIGVSLRTLCSEGGEAEKIYRRIMETKCSNLEEALEGVEVSREVVREILERLRLEERVAVRVFMWAARREGYRHEAAAYSELMHTLSNTVQKAKRFGLLCQTLEYMKRHGGRSVPPEALLGMLKSHNEKQRTRTRTRSSSTSALNLLLQSLCECGLAEDAERTMMRMALLAPPNLRTYSLLLHGWCSVRRPAEAVRLLRAMTCKGFQPDNSMYTAAIEALCLARMPDPALRVFHSMTDPPTARTYSLLIAALLRCDRPDEALRYVGLMMAAGCVPDVPTFKLIVEAMCLAGRTDMASRFMEEMRSRGYPGDILTYNCYLKVLCDNKRCEEAVGLVREMGEKGCEPSVQSYSMLIHMFFEAGDAQGATQAWAAMHRKACRRPPVETYCTMILGFFTCGRNHDACALLDQVVRNRIHLPYHSFHSILSHLSATGNLQAIHTLSKHMRRFYNRAIEARFNLNERRMRVRRGDAG